METEIHWRQQRPQKKSSMKNVGYSFLSWSSYVQDHCNRKANTALNLTMKTTVLLHMNLNSIFLFDFEFFYFLDLRNVKHTKNICAQGKARQSLGPLKHDCPICHYFVKSQDYSPQRLMQGPTAARAGWKSPSLLRVQPELRRIAL